MLTGLEDFLEKLASNQTGWLAQNYAAGWDAAWEKFAANVDVKKLQATLQARAKPSVVGTPSLSARLQQRRAQPVNPAQPVGAPGAIPHPGVHVPGSPVPAPPVAGITAGDVANKFNIPLDQAIGLAPQRKPSKTVLAVPKGNAHFTPPSVGTSAAISSASHLSNQELKQQLMARGAPAHAYQEQYPDFFGGETSGEALRRYTQRKGIRW